jgi:nucleoside-diphosphate-sugar epimerase
MKDIRTMGIRTPMKANDVVKNDLNFMMDCLKNEFCALCDKNLLITGAAGFLGYYLIQSILHWNDCNKDKKPIKLWFLDNFIWGVPKWIAMLEQRDDTQIIKHNIATPLLDTNITFSYIVHAASIASPTYYRLHPIETMDANVKGLRNLLDYALKQKENAEPVKGFLFLSSSEIYGDPILDNIPTSETYQGNVSCTGPRSCYDESKRYGETLCINFSRHYSMPIKIARPFNNYGPGLRVTDKRVVPDFAKNIFSNKDIIMFSDGTPTRTFCYVADAIVGYYKILVNGRTGETYNIGVQGPEISIIELAERLANIGRNYFGYSGKIIRRVSEDKEYLTDSPKRRCPNISKARMQLGYAPSIGLDEGLLRTMCWYSENLQEEE